MADTVVVRNVTLIDGTGAEPAPATDVVVRDGELVARGPGAGDGVDAAQVDGTGAFLIPGLWETETHLTRPVTGVVGDFVNAGGVDVEAAEAHLAAYPVYGFTTVVDLGGPEEFLAELKQRQATGAIPGARVLMTGRQFTAVGGPPSAPDGTRWGTTTVDVDSIDGARAELDRMRELGIDAIKVNMPEPNEMHGFGPTIPIEIVRMLVEQGNAHNLPVHVHIDTADAAIAALGAGVHNVEHFFDPDPLTVDNDVEKVVELCLATGAYWPFTLSLWEGLSRVGEAELLVEREPERTVLPRVLERFLTHPDSLWVQAPEPVRAFQAGKLAAAMRFLPQVHAAGVPFTIATDAGAPCTFHGSAAVREIELSVQAGVAPMDVLLAATRDSARKLRVDDRLGTLEVGKIADMVLLDADPLADISNIRRVRSVFQGGRVTFRAGDR